MNTSDLEHIEVREINVYATEGSSIEDALPEATGFAVKQNIRVILHHQGNTYPIVPGDILEGIYNIGSQNRPPQQPQAPQQPTKEAKGQGQNEK